MKIHSFRVVPALPERLQGLRDIAMNLLWSWDDDLRVVFSRLDRDLWDRTYQNPVLMLGTISQERLEAVARDESFLSYYDRALERLRAYLREPTWWERRVTQRPGVAYFFPRPSCGSACKRLNLYLRWMVRRDRIDVGTWTGVSPSQLVVPLDVHVIRLGRCLGLTSLASPGWRMALSIRRPLTRVPAGLFSSLSRYLLPALVTTAWRGSMAGSLNR